MTTAQALVAFLHAQQVERDGATAPFFAGVLGIFGHGNVAGVGQALQQHGGLRYVLPRNEQAMVHTAVAYARQRNRLQTWACTSSIGPGATNMVTGAALATINRLPVLLLPGDVFASRRVNPALQQLELPGAPDASVNDAFRPVSRFFDRINRPDQLQASLLEAMRVLTDQAETGAVTLALPQDVQAEAHDYPEELFARAGMADRAAGARPGRGAGRGRARAGRAAAADRGRRRRDLFRGDGRPARARRRDRHPRRRDAGRQGVAALRPPRCPRRRRRDGHPCGEPGRARRRRRDRDRHPPGRLHDRLAHRLPGSGRAPDRAQRRRLRRRTSSARCRSSAMPARASRRSPPPCPATGWTPITPSAPPGSRASGTPRWSGCTPARPAPSARRR